MIEASKTADLRMYSSTTGKTSSAYKHQQLKEATQAFEGLFLQQVMKTARETKLGEDLLGGSGVDTMQSMLDEKMSQIGAGGSGLGIGAALYKQFAQFVPGGDKS
ncbi:flagellar biosynthesis protein FlgJ [Donghicola sp. C2-DW-16]|uniref:Flagellar biosynthesis protein FlgJ n=1 Tax=Donghicola mangrovi TaxID=2729614 RepID=A0A850PXZ5_9RHOB|nr:rod-binding protein [Donghicola mangrovi]NVO22097.1 flagellar biosynthesis protein FlgJ [Donghicola mangrovi]NVO26312.1 flagellar biosynthesis protein FlgJ [Donghicola mangrovi]